MKTARLMSPLVVFSLLAPFVHSSHAAISCNPQIFASLIGTEITAESCIPEGMNDNTALYYRYRDYSCVNGVVTLTSVGNRVLITPAGIMDPTLGIFYRTFRNKEGSYFFQVTSAYRGLIDGKSMNSYPTGGVYTDVFTQIFDETLTPPDCKGKQPPDCKLDKASGSSVNMSTGHLQHSQELFRLDNNRTLSLAVSLHYRSSSPSAPAASAMAGTIPTRTRW